MSRFREFAREIWHTTFTHPHHSLCCFVSRLESYDFLSHVGFVQLSIHMMNLCLSFPFQHFAANLKQVRVDEFVIIKGMAKDQNLLKHRVTAEQKRKIINCSWTFTLSLKPVHLFWMNFATISSVLMGTARFKVPKLWEHAHSKCLALNLPKLTCS